MKHNETFNRPSIPGRAAMLAMLACLLGNVDAGTNDVNSAPASAGGPASHDDLAKQLSNPVAAAISVPFQNNFDWGAGPRGNGFQWKMNFQPVLPFHLSEDWNLITRAIIPMISQNDVAGTYLRPSGTQTGLGDVVASAWFSPAKPTSNGLIWGVGPALLFPTGTDDMLTGNQWGAGPTVIALKMEHKFTYGALVNHLWSYAGTGGRPGVNATYMQPFISYLPGGGWTWSLNSESTYDWAANQWTVPVNLMLSKMVKIGKLPAQWQVGARYYVEKPDDGPEWGLRLSLTFLLPD